MKRNYEEYMGGLIDRARNAQQILNEYSQKQVDELVKVIAVAVGNAEKIER